MSALKKASDAAIVGEFLGFMNKAWSAFHAVEECKTKLVAEGFKEILERESWEKIVKPGGRYFCEFPLLEVDDVVVEVDWWCGSVITRVFSGSETLRLCVLCFQSCQ